MAELLRIRVRVNNSFINSDNITHEEHADLYLRAISIEADIWHHVKDMLVGESYRPTNWVGDDGIGVALAPHDLKKSGSMDQVADKIKEFYASISKSYPTLHRMFTFCLKEGTYDLDRECMMWSNTYNR